MDFPDFTRGAWKAQCKCRLMEATIEEGFYNNEKGAKA